MKKLKLFLFDVFGEHSDDKNWIYKVDDHFITTLIILNVFAIILQSYESLNSQYYKFFHLFEVFSVIVFTLEYLIRIWIADLNYNFKRFNKLPAWKCRLKYIFSFMGLIDLLAILPFYLPFIIKLDLRFVRILRLLRLFRIFKLAHYSSSMKIVGKVILDKKYELLTTLFASFVILLISSSLMYEIEHKVQPDQFPNIFATLWWAVATLTTIGYGDVYPITDWGRVLAAVTAIFGIGLVAIPTGIISAGFLEEIQVKKQKTNPRKKKLLRNRIK